MDIKLCLKHIETVSTYKTNYAYYQLYEDKEKEYNKNTLDKTTANQQYHHHHTDKNGYNDWIKICLFSKEESISRTNKDCINIDYHKKE